MRRSLLILFCLMATPAFCAAGDEFSLNFPRGTWTAQSFGGVMLGDSQPIGSGAVGVGYFVMENMSLNAEAYGYGVWNNDPDTGAFGLQLQFRNHMLRGDRWTIFSDVGEGIFEGLDDVPPGGTRLDFTFRSGIGGTYRLRDNLHLIGGVRYFHLSNARLEGSDRNPSINGVEGYIGLMWTWGG